MKAFILTSLALLAIAGTTAASAQRGHGGGGRPQGGGEGARDGGGDRGGYGHWQSDPRFATDYDAARDYRDGPLYSEHRLGLNDHVYRGSDGRYYCRRSDGTTGLIIGAAGGALLGSAIDNGGDSVAGPLVGGALGAILGSSIDRDNDGVRCR